MASFARHGVLPFALAAILLIFPAVVSGVGMNAPCKTCTCHGPDQSKSAMFYGVDGDCRACPGVSLSRKGTEKIEDCECPVSPRRALWSTTDVFPVRGRALQGLDRAE
ncbi:hypothetical protein T484DRAFT_1859885 [Baffinella frigidus]|nr:hypothetical protein T484DRAFT_1859885 [Cryptophyta sp. CCMP2293]